MGKGSSSSGCCCGLKAWLLFIVVAADVVAWCFGQMAENSQDEVKSVGVFGVECTKRRNGRASELGAIAAYSVGVAHLVALFLGRCAWLTGLPEYCGRSGRCPPGNPLSFLAWVLMWVCFGAAELVLVRGANANKKSSGISCHISTDGWLKVGAWLAVAHSLCAWAFYFFAEQAFSAEYYPDAKPSKSTAAPA
ncbi:unnamed protein product [Cuscuta epithymum]|uniref:Uncharacterized protein n=1 Tax=Cuscuta epithymum TaxID=186058 RepID=A0AAV0CIW4_9ASTE|nr:unnamed protein product [Cuscuta epithymum]